MVRRRSIGWVALLVVALGAAPVAAETIEQRLERMEQEIRDLKQELRQRDAEDAKRRSAETTAPSPSAPVETAAPAHAPTGTTGKGGAASTATDVVRAITDRVKIGGYGSGRFETSSLSNQNTTFTYRRFVLTTDANIAPRLRGYFELEFERFRELELEKSNTTGEGGLTVEQTVEGTNGSEISFEQGWLQFDLTNDWLKFRAGEVLVPVGRFNINHDDNLWNLPRRSLVDRGTPVLPVTAAWGEIGAGFVGDVALGRDSMVNYQTYVLNGVTLDTEFEQIARTRNPESTETAIEVKVSPSTGTFGSDTKNAKAWAGRLAYSPFLGQELGFSGYWGRYTPDFLSNETLWTLGTDGLFSWGPFDLEGEFLYTNFGGVKNVAKSLAQVAVNGVSETENPDLNTEVEFELSGLASHKYGYWLEARYHWWPQSLNDTIFGKYFTNPQFVAVLRGEQVWLDDLVTEADFAGGVLQTFNTSNRFVNRITPGLAYRPTPLVVFQLAYEFTWTNSGQSLSGVTNYLAAGPRENTNSAFLMGAAFGF